MAIEVIHNAVDLDLMSPPRSRGNGPPIVAFVGRTTAVEKDFPRFTRIAKHLTDRGARVWVADPHEAGWQSFTDLPVVRVDTERWERVPHGRMPDFYRAVAESGGAVFMPSRVEGFGNVATEAAACGAMTIAADVLGLRESVIPGRTGMLFSPDATDETVASLAWDQMASQPSPGECAEAARAFSPARMADSYIAVYDRVDQRLTTSAAPKPTDPGLDVLFAHLTRQHVWRADACISAAAGFSARGYHALALAALRLAARDAPLRLLRARGLKEAALLALRIVHRPSRLLRQTRRAQFAATVPSSDK